MAKARYKLFITGGEKDEVHALKAGVTSIGRIDGNDIVLPHHFVSSRHAQIDVQVEVTAAGVFLTDLGSTNGTIVDGQPLPARSPRKLLAKTEVIIGPYTLSVKVVAALNELPKADKSALVYTAALTKEVETTAATTQLPDPPIIQAPPPRPPRRPPNDDSVFEPNFTQPPIGLDYHSSRLLNYLPGIYHNDFMARFLGIFEAILTPLEWNVDNFDLFLHARTAPADFLPWLAGWFDMTFDDTWTVAQKRLFLSEAHQIFAMRGTRWSLKRILEIYTGKVAEITDLEDEKNPFSFTVKLPITRAEINPEIIEQIIDIHKPAHTTYKLFYKRG